MMVLLCCMKSYYMNFGKTSGGWIYSKLILCLNKLIVFILCICMIVGLSIHVYWCSSSESFPDKPGKHLWNQTQTQIFTNFFLETYFRVFPFSFTKICSILDYKKSKFLRLMMLLIRLCFQVISLNTYTRGKGLDQLPTKFSSRCISIMYVCTQSIVSLWTYDYDSEMDINLIVTNFPSCRMYTAIECMYNRLG